MSWVTIRRIYQVFFLALFVALLVLAGLGQIQRFPVSVFLEANPLLALATTLATHIVFAGMALSIIVVVITLLFGRVFCSWICPLGILNHWISALPPLLLRRERIKDNRWRPAYQTKYYVLIALLVLAAFGVVQVGLLDPIALTTRVFAITIFPGAQLAGAPLYAIQPVYVGGWVVGALFVLILAANRFITRLWCRMLCPLGALLGFIAKFSLIRIHRDTDACKGCALCKENCHGACEPHAELRVSDCLMCLNCLDSCPSGAQHCELLPPVAPEALAPNLQRRKAVAAVASGVALVPVLRTSQGVLRGADHDVIRPPGALPEEDFVAKCIKCGACIRACPTGVLQPASVQAGIEGLWTPILRFDMGFCSHDCTACGQVCPTGAIKPLTPQERVGTPPKKPPVKLGTAFFDRGRCLPWAMGTPCIVCEEVCPTSPKAIWLEPAEVKNSAGEVVKVQLPHLDPDRCVGCGTCQLRCPVGAKAAIRVSSVGETRSPDNQILLKSY